jgi:hypothetical protein
VAPPGAIDMLLRLADKVRGRRLLHVSGGRFGGGPAEILHTLVPMMVDLGVEAAWEITGGDPGFYTTATALRAALDGAERVLADEALDHYVEMNRVNAVSLDVTSCWSTTCSRPLVARRAPAALVWLPSTARRPSAGRGRSGRGSPVRRAIFSLPRGRRLGIPATSSRLHRPAVREERDLTSREVTTILRGLGIAQDRPILLQVAPFDGRGRSASSTPPAGEEALQRAPRAGRHRRRRPGGPGHAGRAAGRRPGTTPTSACWSCRPTPTCRSTLQRAATIVLQKSVHEASGARRRGCPKAARGQPTNGAGRPHWACSYNNAETLDGASWRPRRPAPAAFRRASGADRGRRRLLRRHPRARGSDAAAHRGQHGAGWQVRSPPRRAGRGAAAATTTIAHRLRARALVLEADAVSATPAWIERLARPLRRRRPTSSRPPTPTATRHDLPAGPGACGRSGRRLQPFGGQQAVGALVEHLLIHPKWSWTGADVSDLWITGTASPTAGVWEAWLGPGGRSLATDLPAMIAQTLGAAFR